MGLLYADATGKWSDPAKTGYRYLRADAQWAGADAAHKYLDAEGRWTAPELVALAPFTLNGIDAARCTAENRAANGVWLDPEWTEGGTDYGLYATVPELALEPSADVDLVMTEINSYDRDGAQSGLSGADISLCTEEYRNAHAESCGSFESYSPSDSAQSSLALRTPEGADVTVTLRSPGVKLAVYVKWE